MLLAKLITPKKINALGCFRFSVSVILIAFCFPAFSQDNSPYTRYGLGDIVPSTNINTRAMGGLSAGYRDPYAFTINFNNPATYGSFFSVIEAKSRKTRWGRAILDLGINVENRTLIDPNKTGKFTTSNALFSYLQVGVPLKSNWGLSFGLRPITRISYKMIQGGRVRDAVTGLPKDSTLTLSEGDGGAYLATVGTGFRIKNFSFGLNTGYLFGKKDISDRVSVINDSVEFNSGNFQTKTTYGNLYLNGGIQYLIQLDSSVFMTLGAYGNMKQKMNASQDIINETFFYDQSVGNSRIDSVYEKRDVKGKIEYPASFTAGFTIQKTPKTTKEASWLLGVDFNYSKWEDYRFYGQQDSVRNKWEVRIGGEIRPSIDAGRKSYFGNVSYRAGFFIGPDYIRVKEKLPLLGASLGLGLPITNFNRLNNQVSIINLAFEYIKRGNNNNLLKENIFRISAGFSLSDLWFIRKKYE